MALLVEYPKFVTVNISARDYLKVVVADFHRTFKRYLTATATDDTWQTRVHEVGFLSDMLRTAKHRAKLGCGGIRKMVGILEMQYKKIKAEQEQAWDAATPEQRGVWITESHRATAALAVDGFLQNVYVQLSAEIDRFLPAKTDPRRSILLFG